MKFKKKIFLSYIFLIAAFIIINAIIMGGLFSFVEKNSFKESNIFFSQNTADRINIYMREYLYKFPLKFHSKILELMTMNTSLKNIELFSVNNKLLYSYTDFFKRVKKPYISFPYYYLKNVNKKTFIKSGYFIVIVPIIEENGEHKLSIVYYYRYILFWNYFFKAILLIVLINLPLFTLLALILNKYSSKITNSVEQLAEFADKMRKKEFDEKIELRSTDEFKNLSLTMSEMAEEISKSIKREKELRKLLESVIENSPNGIIIIDENKKIIFKNTKFINQYEKNIKLLWYIFDSLDEIKTTVEKKIEDRHFLIISYEIPVNKKVVLIEDITDEIIMKEKILFAQKMESLGIFVSSFVHDIKNMIGVISGYLDIVKDTDLNGKNKPYINKMEEGLNNAENLIMNFLRFSKGTKEDLKLYPIVEVLEESLSLVSRNLDKAKVIKEIKIDKGTMIKCNKEDIIQMLINIILNAKDAVSNKDNPMIKIGIKLKKIEEHHILSPSNYVKITIEDNGIGIKKEHIGKIFEPFFSTKEKKGTGLGLFSCYLIAKKHNGIIEVDSKEGKGTVFYIYLKADE